MELGIAYPTFAGVSVVLTMIVGMVFFREQFAWTKVAGAALIVGGMVVAYR